MKHDYGCIGCLIGLLFLAVGLLISWGITVGIVALVCLCFAWQFNWLTATGIWLIMCLISAAFGSSRSRE